MLFFCFDESMLNRKVLLTHLLTWWMWILAAASSDAMAHIDEPTQSGSLRVASYSYPGLDREKALLPIKQQLESLYNKSTTIVVYDSPTALVTATLKGDMDIIVPNLAAYLQLKLAGSVVSDIAVPAASIDIDGGSLYTSSIVTHEQSDVVSLEALVENLADVSIGMVWPDSASGGLIASTHLSGQYKISAEQLKQVTTYLGSHQKVLDSLVAGNVDVGVIATALLRQYQSESKNIQTAELVELWRSAPLPFGPVACYPSVRIDCNAFKAAVLQNNDAATAILAGLKQGWPEFQSSDSLVVVDVQMYEALVHTLKEK